MSSGVHHDDGLVRAGVGNARAATPQNNLLTSSVRSALVLYGSETGNAQDIAQEIGHLLDRYRFDTTVTDLDSIELKDLISHSLVIFVVSTAGQGEFPQNARLFWRLLLSSRLKLTALKRVRFATFGLGDSSYPKYNVASRMLYGRLVQLGAEAICSRGEGNEQHPEGHHAAFRAWIVELSATLSRLWPLSSSQTLIPEGVFIEPKWKLQMGTRLGLSTSQGTCKSIKLSKDDGPDDSIIPIRESIIARVESNTRLTPETHDQDVRLLDLEVPGHVEYGPGAVAVIYPKNFPADVQQFINLMQWNNIADCALQLVCSGGTSSTHSTSPLRAYGYEDDDLTLRKLLIERLDIMSIPRRFFFCSLASFAGESDEEAKYQKERLLELGDPTLVDELWDYTTRPRRTILEVMCDFTTIKIPWQYAFSVVPLMRGRQFSIASGGTLKISSEGRTRIQLLVAIANPPNPIIKYRKRHGVCSRYIATLASGQKLAVEVQKGYLDTKRQDGKKPVVLVGPGTGVAPMRSLIYERLASQSDSLACSTLFFGCRKATADYFFREEWERLATNHHLIVHAAFSRNPGHPRTYVQDLMRQQGREVYDALYVRAGKFYVCGSSGDMPRGVRQALVDILVQYSDDKDEKRAEAYLDRMEKEGRYKQETW